MFDPHTHIFNPHTNCVIGAGIQSKKREDPSLGSLAVKSSLSVCEFTALGLMKCRGNDTVGVCCTDAVFLSLYLSKMGGVDGKGS